MLEQLKILLGHLEEKADIKSQSNIEKLYKKTLLYEPVERLPIIMSYPLDADAAFKPFPHHMIFDNPEIMLYNELVHAWGLSIANNVGDDLPWTIRANFGTVIIASLYGAQIEQREDNPPWVKHHTDEAFGYDEVFDIDPEDLTRGWCPKVFQRYHFYKDILQEYPNLLESIKLVLPDLQGPMDAAEQIRGSEIYCDFYSQPEHVNKLLSHVSKSIVTLEKKLETFLINKTDGFSYQHGTMIKGNILLRNDSSTMVSPQMYEEAIRPLDAKILEEVSGGIHSCGDISHLARSFLNCPGCGCLDLGQPELNNVDQICEMASARKIPLLRVKVNEDQLITKSITEKYPTGVTLLFEADSIQHARKTMSEYASTN